MADMSEGLLDLADGVYAATVDWQGMIREIGDPDLALTASVIPVNPPSDWFNDPKFTRVSPMTIEKTGRVMGHIAAWHTSHIGMAGSVKPPKSKSGYRFFRTGVVETAEGDMVDVGQITLAGGHAPLEASVAKTVAHYDNTESAVMDVAAGEDKYGIWVAGALRPGVTDEQIRTLRASSVSGDWRPINGRLELVAVCAVNCPGFPIPRARVAAGAPVSLVAAGTEPIVQAILASMNDDAQLVYQALDARMTHLEETIVAQGMTPTTDVSNEIEDLRRRVHVNIEVETKDEDQDALAASLRARVMGESVGEDLVEQLRARVRNVA